MFVRVAAASTAIFWGSPVYAQRLEAVLEQALVSDPEISRAQMALRAAEAGVQIARAERGLSVTTDVRYEFAKDDEIARNQFRPNLAGGLDLQLLIWSGGRVKNQIAVEQARRDESLAQYDATVNDRLAQTAGRYASLVRDEAVLKVTLEQVETLAADALAARSRADRGDLTATDVNQVTARLANARGLLASARASLTVSGAEVAEITGEEIARPIDPAMPELQPMPLDAELKRQLENAPEIRAATAREAAAQAQLRLASSQRMPMISFTARYQITNRAERETPYIGSRSLSAAIIGLTFSMPFYQGGLVAASERQARASLQTARAQKLAVERALAAEVRSRYALLEAVGVTAEALQRALSAAKEAEAGVAIGHQYGERTFIDLLNARREVLNIEEQLAGVRRNRVASAYEILALMGNLTDSKRTPADVKQDGNHSKPKLQTAVLWKWNSDIKWSLPPGPNSYA